MALLKKSHHDSSICIGFFLSHLNQLLIYYSVYTEVSTTWNGSKIYTVVLKMIKESTQLDSSLCRSTATFLK